MFLAVTIMFFELFYYYIIVSHVIKINQMFLSHLNDQILKVHLKNNQYTFLSFPLTLFYLVTYILHFC